MKLKIETYLSTFVDGKRETWLSMGRACITDTSYASVEELRKTLKDRFPHEKPVDVDGGVRMSLGRSAHDYQIVTLIP